ncbi:hypothetical protein N7535_005065 [Penicillium sp. DV-2018c]|nr:hypothetical protein N7461_008645 [Penicillium sp. DV-2018c]KAJ5571405.1 hypothetical protein N7535_005065 [Penicillium sp. DV-2018c]
MNQRAIISLHYGHFNIRCYYHCRRRPSRTFYCTTSLPSRLYQCLSIRQRATYPIRGLNTCSKQPQIYHAAQISGVQFFLGQPVDDIIYVSTLTGRKIAGIRTRNARFHSSSTVIIEAGAGDGKSLSGIGYAFDSLATPFLGISTSRTP